MKKTITIKLLCAIIIVFTACSTSQYDGWKTINIDNCGALKIPEENMVVGTCILGYPNEGVKLEVKPRKEDFIIYL